MLRRFLSMRNAEQNKLRLFRIRFRKFGYKKSPFGLRFPQFCANAGAAAGARLYTIQLRTLQGRIFPTGGRKIPDRPQDQLPQEKQIAAFACSACCRIRMGARKPAQNERNATRRAPNKAACEPPRRLRKKEILCSSAAFIPSFASEYKYFIYPTKVTPVFQALSIKIIVSSFESPA